MCRRCGRRLVKMLRAGQLELSGGLDSSIVAACLKNRPAPWRAFNLATPEYRVTNVITRAPPQCTPERRSPRSSCPTRRRTRSAPIPIPRARPGGFGLLGSSDEALLAAARDFGAEAIFTGVGGDNVFGYIRKAGPVADALQFAGFGEAWRAASDLATMTGDSVWRALRLALSQMIGARRLWPATPLC